MSVNLIVPPVEMAVLLGDARDAARVEGTALDGEIIRRVRGVTAMIEHQLGRAIITQTYRVSLEAFPEKKLRLPFAPVQSVTNVKYIDSGGAEQILSSALYILDKESTPSYLELIPGGVWPATTARANAVTVEVVCGYGDNSTTTPPGLQDYILAKVQEYFAAPGMPAAPDLERLLDPYMVY